jgi:peptidyl-Asp metalloendopeptidase
VHHECAALKYSLAHEIGHFIGARHELSMDDSTVPFPFGHGFVDGRKNWRDIMSYEESCGGCPRLPVFSNPDIKVFGAPAGDDKTNNARVIRERASIVAGFR